MSDYRLEDFKTRIRAIGRLDTGSATTALMQGYINDFIKVLQVEVKFPKKVTELSKTVGGAAFAEFSSVADFDTSNIIDIRSDSGPISIISKEVFDKVQPVQNQTSGTPQIAVPLTDTKLNLFPYGTDTVWNIKYNAKHFDFSADSQMMSLDDIAFATICNQVAGELLDWKDDSRAAKYQAKAQAGMNILKKKFNEAPVDQRMQPGDANNTSGDWERIYGDAD